VTGKRPRYREANGIGGGGGNGGGSTVKSVIQIASKGKGVCM